MSFGRHIDNTYIYNVLDHNNCMIPLARVDKVKDLGLWAYGSMNNYRLKNICMIKLAKHIRCWA